MKHKHLIFLIAFALLPVFVMAAGQSECTQNDNFGRFNTKPIFKRTFLNQSVTRTTNKITRKPISSVHNRNMNEDIVITYEDFLEHLSPDKERLLQYYIHTIPMDVKGVDTTAAPTQSWVWDMPNLDNAQSNYSILQLSSEESEEFLDLYPTLTHVGYGVPNDAFGFYELTDNSQNEGFLTLLGELDFFGEDFYQLDYDLVAAPVPAELGWVVEGVITYIFEEESNIDTIRLLPALDTLVIDELLDSIKFVQDLEIVACGTLNTYDDGSVPALKIHNHETYLAYRNDTIIDSGVLGRQVWWYSEEGHFIRARLKDDQPFSGSTIFQSMLYQKLVDAPLPIAWTDFTAKVNNRKQVELTWQTTTEQDNSHFIIQKSTDGKTFIKIGEQAGKGNSTAMQTYNFKDKEPTIGTNYYRIQQIDNDGKSTFSEVITAIILDDSETNPTVVLYPNPGKNEVWFSQPADYELFDSKGQLLTSGQADGVVDVSGLAAGTYFVRINGGAMQSWLKN